MSQPTNTTKTGRVRVMQIIAFALIQGVAVFLAVAVFLSWGRPPGDPILEQLAAVFAAAAVLARFVIPAMVARGQVRQAKIMREELAARDSNDDQLSLGEQKLYAVYQTTLIIGMAMLEGAALFAGVAYLVGRHPWGLGIMGALLGMMIFSFPTTGRIEHWVEEQRRLLEWET